MESPFFVYLSRVAKKPVNDTAFKFLERRHQWQRRNFNVQEALAPVTVSGATAVANLKLGAKYDIYGKESATYVGPNFLLANQTVDIKADVDGTMRRVTLRITNIDSVNATYTQVDGVIRAIDGDTDYATTYSGLGVTFTIDQPGQVTGSAFREASGAPDSWADKLSDREGYCQIFKTTIQLFSGSSLATEYRGIKNEWKRQWAEKLMEHKMDIEYAMLMGVGAYAAEDGTDPQRFTWGIMPYTELYGKVYNFTYGSSGYDDFIDAMKNFFAPETGNSRDKLVLTSRNILAWLNKLSGDSFLGNTVGSSAYRLDVQQIQGKFGHEVTRVRTIFGNLHFVEEPLLRELYEDFAIAVDMKNVKYRPLKGNGISRDTHIITNIQNNDIDGRQDLILTEAGLEIQLPETHAVLKWA
jgi:hypothetical protein